MLEYVFPSKRQGWLCGVRGTVIGAKVWTETHVTSSGGGGYIHNGQGRIEAPQVQTRIVEKGEVWLRTAKGRDVQLQLRIPVIEGQDLLVLWGNVNAINGQTGPYLYWKNFSSDKHALFTLLDLRFFETREEASKRRWRFWGLWLSITFFIGLMAAYNDPGDPLWMIIGVFIGLVVAFLFSRPGNMDDRAITLRDEFSQLSSKNDMAWDN